MRELDVLLVGYLDQFDDNMQADDEALFEHLLEQTDMDLYAWFTGRSRPPDSALARLIEQILGRGVQPPRECFLNASTGATVLEFGAREHDPRNGS